MGKISRTTQQLQKKIWGNQEYQEKHCHPKTNPDLQVYKLNIKNLSHFNQKNTTRPPPEGQR